MSHGYSFIESALILNRAPEIGPVRFRSLLHRFGTPEAVLAASPEELMQVEGMTPAAARSVAEASTPRSEQRSWAKVERERAAENGVEILCWDHPVYPALLKTLSDAPPILYCKGRLSSLSLPMIAIVGSRKPTPYGEKAARIFAGGLAELGIATVSGLARGIDTCVHAASLAAGSPTLAVLGSGLQFIYPRENRSLAESIYKEGAVLSEFPLDEAPQAHNFPRRNRIVSGLALGTIVVEAGSKSGALITARYAAEQGREVFAVPGPITLESSRGSNRLLKNGAKLVDDVTDVLEEISLFRAKFARMIYKERAPEPLPALNQNESAVLGALGSEPTHIDRLYQQFKLSSGAFSKVLLDLELKGMVKPLPGKWYVRI